MKKTLLFIVALISCDSPMVLAVDRPVTVVVANWSSTSPLRAMVPSGEQITPQIQFFLNIQGKPTEWHQVALQYSWFDQIGQLHDDSRFVTWQGDNGISIALVDASYVASAVVQPEEIVRADETLIKPLR